MTENSSKLIEQTQTKDSRKKYQYQKKIAKTTHAREDSSHMYNSLNQLGSR